MAIIFHEGMSGSGKSYEAVVTQIIPALQAGRAVDVYIEGINHQRIAECAELPLDRVQDLLISFTREQVTVIHQSARDNALVVIDEAQNFWPTGRQKLDPNLTQFITEHRHRGIDILLMGQVFGDVHKLWRGRITQKNFYLKQDAVGRENHYTCTVYKATAPERFEKISTKLSNTYDPKYFGTYASVVDDSISTANFKDKRATLLGSTFAQYGVPAVVACLVLGGYGTYRFFKPKAETQATATAAQTPAPAASQAVPYDPAPAKAKKTYVAKLNEDARIRLDWLVIDSHGTPHGIIAWYKEGGTVFERLNLDQLRMLGATIVFMDATMVKVDDAIATQWPLQTTPRPATPAPSIGGDLGKAVASAL